MNILTKEQLTEITKKADILLDSWLKESELTKEALLAFRKCRGFKIIDNEHKLGEAVYITLVCKYGENNDPVMIGCPIIAVAGMDRLDEEAFYCDAHILLMAITQLLDNENLRKLDSYTNRYFGAAFDRFCENNHKIKSNANEFCERYGLMEAR